ncbi:MAG: bifunctional YncE family protein/alkaline phosphatase family protein, partial [Planctomycetia bacterium]
MLRRSRFVRPVLSAALFAVFAADRPAPGDDAPAAKTVARRNVGVQTDGSVVTPTNQLLRPAGRQSLFAGRPVDVALSPNGRFLAVLNRRDVMILSATDGAVLSQAGITGSSYKGLLFTPDGSHLYASTLGKGGKAAGGVRRFAVSAEGSLTAADPKPKGKDADSATVQGSLTLPVGLAWTADAAKLLVASNLDDELRIVDPTVGVVEKSIPVGRAPFAVAVVGGTAYVSCLGGRAPVDGDRTADAGVGSRVRVDERFIANDGSVSVVDLATGRQTAEIAVGLHPSGIAASPDGRRLVVANANGDTLSVIDPSSNKIVESLLVRPSGDRSFGSAPQELVFAADGRRLYVANGGDNAAAVVDFHPAGGSKLLGYIPTGWYPAGVAFDATKNRLFVANVKGVGSRDDSWKGRRVVKGEKVFGYNSHDHRGSVSIIDLPSDLELRRHTEVVLENNRDASATASKRPARPYAAPRPIPERDGEPSVFKHVVYIIKENRTYDQVFGDLPQGEGDPSLCLYGREVTPNCHKLVEEFVLLDNFYCSGVLSADGHQWATEAYATGYLERAFGGFARSYPYDGGDALAYGAGGFLWDNALAHGKTLRIYGEFVGASIKWKDPARKGSPGFLDCYKDFLAGNKDIEIKATANIATLQPYVCETFIGFPSEVPDVHRAGEYLKELKRYEAEGVMPNLSILLLPNDHTSGLNPGMPTPEASVADNDLALGRIVEGISKSRFWKETCILVVQDDPQNGFDHIDGHRTVALAVSPYTKRRAVVSTNYNQTGMVRTIERILGLPPMNQYDAAATIMSDCFTDTPDFTPYDAVPNLIPLDRMNKSVAEATDPVE